MSGRVAMILACGCLAAGAAFAVEGKWTPEQLLEHDPRWLRALGLEVAPATLWRPDGDGLLAAAVRIDGCSAGFISERGLLLTNHHCAFSILQQHSTPRHDLITEGFLAAAPERELSGEGVRATVPHRITDVSAAVAAAVPAGADDLARYRAIEGEKKRLVADCERQESRRCEVAAFDGGSRHLLFENLEYPDVRLVYAPPRAVGDFGGETDNWSWPRHAGDFALLRVYSAPGGKPAARSAANLPYRPRHFFPVAPRGVRPGELVMVAGYPVLTYRSLIEPEMRERAETTLPRRAQILRAWIDMMDAAAASDKAAQIALADRIKALANNEKNARGQIAGMVRGRVLERKRAAEGEVLAWVERHPEHAAAAAAHAELARRAAERLGGVERDLLLELMKRGPKPLDLALTLVRHAHEQAKPDLEREPAYMERNRERLADSLRRDQKRFFLPAEAALLADLLARFAALPGTSRVPAAESLLAQAGDPDALRSRAADPLARSRVLDLDERVKMFTESEEQLRARRDPLLDLAAGLDLELRAAEERDHRFRGAESRLRPPWLRAVAAHAGKPVAPDANGTLRVTLGHVQGYSSRDGIWMQPQTTVAGLVAKHTGEEPFNAPASLRAAAARAAASRWADPALKDVPVCFLADADTSGGNSGSPVLNGRGELVGVNFDRVWENVANDFGYNPEVARNISVDVRFLLWVLSTASGEATAPAARLLAEMGIDRR
ncbi:MAG TPA: S46 family peptidase [Thermoanaerobaculia bacterium]|nr:S46 family peptidase [Thermoanaerobaculia bacterium]